MKATFRSNPLTEEQVAALALLATDGSVTRTDGVAWIDTDRPAEDLQAEAGRLGLTFVPE